MKGRIRTAVNTESHHASSAEEGGPDIALKATEGTRGFLAPRLARAVVASVLTGYGVITLLNVEYALRDRTGAQLLSYGLVAVLFAIQLALTTSGARTWPLWCRAAALAVQTLVTLVPMVWLDVVWGSLAGPLCATILLLLPTKVAWPCFAALPTWVLVWQVQHHASVPDAAYYVISTALTGLVIYGLTRLTDLVRDVHEARAEMARMAVTQERLRFARDLHDLLGYSLSAITLKSELIHRLVVVNPERARDEVASVLSVSRQALADVRLVASGYRDMSLEVEAESVAEVMSAADMSVNVDIACGRLHPIVDTVLATALREGVTNILRHSKVQSCTIRADVTGDTARLVLINDGVSGSGARRPEGSRPATTVEDSRGATERGSGLGNLATRLAAIGGTLTAGEVPGGRFRLMAEAPVRPVQAAGGRRGAGPPGSRGCEDVVSTAAGSDDAGRPAA
ncbi:sensor histidine kinase [Streptomyces sp. NPDC006879]|uniref:sensor histidine kinase n=1 Tax=Streptomyces sp. NPDC006879 TaxID=3364767 RepID=UPI0036B9BFB9